MPHQYHHLPSSAISRNQKSPPSHHAKKNDINEIIDACNAGRSALLITAHMANQSSCFLRSFSVVKFS
ncbi:MAG: hypothetical protein QNL33_09685 [Akkermansiaceae bacterium]